MLLGGKLVACVVSLTLYDSVKELGGMLELTKTIGLRIDDELHERTGLAGLLSPSQIHRIKVAKFRIESYEELNYGDTVIPRVNWSAKEEYIYGEDEVQDFVRVIRNFREFDSALSQLGEAELRQRDKGTLQLYLTSFVYFVTNTLLKDRGASQERMAEAFMKDVEEDRIQTLVKIGLAGIIVRDGPIEMSKDVQLRRLNRSDYHEESEPLTDKSIHQASFPSQHPSASSVLELSVKPGPKLDPLFGPIGFFDVRMYSSVREFDLLIQQLIPLAQVWKGTLELVQSETDSMTRFVHVELNLPTLSPEGPIFRWKQQYRTHEPRRSLSISRDDNKIVKLPLALVSKNYGRLVYPIDGAETPLSLAYSRYMNILQSREACEKTIRDEVEALESFFTPGLDVSKAFIPRVDFLVRTVAVDENETANLLRNAYDIRSSYTHRGGWDESVHAVTTTEEAGFAWESYKRDLANILLVYLRLSIVSRVLSQYDEKTFIDVLDKSEKTGVAHKDLAALSKQVSCKIYHVSDFVRDTEATKKYQIPLHIIRNRIEKRLIAAITLRRPLRNGQQGTTNLVSEWALLSLKEEMDNLSLGERKTT